MTLTQRPHRPRRRPVAMAAFATFALAACGGSDSDSTAEDAADIVESDADTNSENTASDAGGSDEAPIGVGDDGEIEFTDDLDGAIDSVGFDQVIEIAAGQLNPEPSVEVNGDNATLTFPEGSVDLDSIIPCTVVGTFTSGDQTVTVVYPDGERVC